MLTIERIFRTTGRRAHGSRLFSGAMHQAHQRWGALRECPQPCGTKVNLPPANAGRFGSVRWTVAEESPSLPG